MLDVGRRSEDLNMLDVIKMLFYIYCGYIGSLAVYSVYEYWGVAKFTYNIASGVYNWTRKDIYPNTVIYEKDEDWELI
jgi:hypothetical protein